MATSIISNTVTGVPSFAVIARLRPGRAFRTGDSTELASEVSTTASTAGLWSLTLERNADIDPTGTYWEIEEHLPPASGGSRTWTINVGPTNATLRASLITALPAGTVPEHLSDAIGAHAASAVSFGPTGSIAAIDVQAAIAEVDAEKETPAGATAKVNTHDASLTAHNGTLVPLALVDAPGDLLVGTGPDALGRLAKGAALQVLRVNAAGTALEYAAPAAGGGDPFGWGFPITADPAGPFVNIMDTDNQGRWARVIGNGTITKIGLEVVVSAGNISVAVYRNTGTGRGSAPGARVATTGAVACPASGWAEVALGASVVVNLGDWICLTASLGSAKFAGTGQFVASNAAQGRGMGYAGSAHPAPDPAPALTWYLGGIPLLIGIP